jgi:hypothetical protein
LAFLDREFYAIPQRTAEGYARAIVLCDSAAPIDVLAVAALDAAPM